MTLRVTETFDLAGFRSLFPALTDVVYLNTATAPPACLPVLDALRRSEGAWERAVFSWRNWEDEAEATRGLFADLIGAPAGAVALLGSLSEAAATVARSLPAGRIVVGEQEFRSNLWPWLALGTGGRRIVQVAAQDGVVSTDSLVEAITPGTALVAVSAIQSSNGYRVDLEPIAERTRAVGARLFVNLTQLLGALRFDIEEIEPDFVAAHGYKWMLCPRGAAWLYVRPDRLEGMRPLAPNWKNADDPHATYYGGELDLATDARRLDASLAWFSWVGARAALELLVSLERSQVERRCLELTDAFRRDVTAAGFEVAPQGQPSQIVAIRVDDPDRLRRRLESERVVASVRGGGLRIGFHAFNDESDVDTCLRVLKDS